MLIVVNGQEREVKDQSTLREALVALNVKLEGTAVAVDDDIVPKEQWDTFLLREKMKVDVFGLVAGG